MKTAVQQIIEKFEYIQKNDCKTLPEVIFFDGVLAILETEFLKIEKDQIKRAFNVGGTEAYEQSSEDYYKETFETNK